jgi:hypothetical protein
MSKIKIKEGNHEEMVLISQFLLNQGFTPVYPLETSNWKDDQFGVHDVGGGWRILKNDREWRCVEPIPHELIVSNFDLPPTVRICWFPDSPEFGISLASDATPHYETIGSEALSEHLAQSGEGYDIGSASE